MSIFFAVCDKKNIIINECDKTTFVGVNK